MNTLHYSNWPPGLPYNLTVPSTSVYTNLLVSAMRYPNKSAVIYYGKTITYETLKREVDNLAGYLQKVCKIKRGERVLLQMQNSPQFVIAYYAILRADAVVVPVNTMLLTEEIRYLAEDSEAVLAICSQELLSRVQPVAKKILVSCYSEYIEDVTCAPEWVQSPKQTFEYDNVVYWSDALSEQIVPDEHCAGSDDLACLPYTSGTTGNPKGCMHTHSSLMFNAISGAQWAGGVSADHITLASLPFFHVTGMQLSMNSTIYSGSTLIIMSKWDKDLTGHLISKHKVTSWACISTMMIDFLSNPKLSDYDISSLRRLSGGGAPMPAAIAQKLFDLTGLRYMEGYGLTETIATSHSNPLHNCKQQCLGIPTFNTDSRVIDPETLKELDVDEIGEIIINGPQVFRGYWKDEEKTKKSFIEFEGKMFFRTGDLGYKDSKGFFFFTDRLKRMINASGFKVWPAEIESMLYKHPKILESCVIAAKDSYRGETVKALVVPKASCTITEEELIQWCKENMAAYKVPRLVSVVESLPKSASGKIMWRQLQEAEQIK